MIGFVTWSPFCTDIICNYSAKGGQVTKPIIFARINIIATVYCQGIKTLMKFIKVSETVKFSFCYSISTVSVTQYI